MLNDTRADGAPPAGDTGDLIRETTTAAFRQDVIAESMHRPVLVDFWAPWCGPCKQLTPVLERAVRAAAGKVVLAKLNIDEHPSIWGQISQQLGLQSIPAVIAIDKGRPVDMFTGAVPESEVRRFIERLAGPSPIEAALSEAAALVGEGDLAGAAELFAAVLEQEPDNVAALAGLAKLQLDAGEIENAKRVLAMVPEAKVADPALAGIRAALELAEQAASLGDLAGLEKEVEANPDAHQARFDLALGLAAGGERGRAVDHLIELRKRDKDWNEDGARKQLLQFFEAWGVMDPDTIRGRRKLSAVLFS